MGSGDRILIRLPNWLGDVLMARRMLHGLRAAHPGAILFGVAPAPLLDLLAAERHFTEARPWAADAASRARVLAEVRRFAPQTALVLPPSFSSAWFAWKSGARRRIGYAHEGRSLLLTDALPRGARGDRHLSEEYLAIGAALGASDVPLPDLPVPHAAADGPPEVERGRPLALLGPGAIYGPAKRWSAARFAALARTLVSRGMRVAVCGTAAERGTCDRVAADAGEGVQSVAGRTSLLDVAGLCRDAALAVCNDSGLAHLAAATGTPTVALFGSTSSAWTAPLGRRVRIVQSAPPCAPCFQRTCRIGYPCLQGIDVERVAAACVEAAA